MEPTGAGEELSRLIGPDLNSSGKGVAMHEARRLRSSHPKPGAHGVEWRTSSYSGVQGNCVEVGRRVGVVGVRDTKDRDGGTLLLTRRTWAAFLEALKNSHRPRPST